MPVVSTVSPTYNGGRFGPRRFKSPGSFPGVKMPTSHDSSSRWSKTAWLSLSIVSLAAVATQAAAERNWPNILWLVAGDRAAHVTGCYGNTKAQTPKVDALSENTIVVYLGDHGYCPGHHGRFEKHCSYEQAARAPLLIRHPGHIGPGSSTDVLVELIDVVPTLPEYCGLAVPEPVQGRSLVRVLAGTAAHREHVFVEYAWADEIMVRHGRRKLVFIRGKRKRPDSYATGRPLPGHTLKLFDLQNDPDEFTNLAKRPERAGRVRHYLGLLVDLVKRTSRHPELIPTSDDPLVVLDYCVQPHDDLPAGGTP